MNIGYLKNERVAPMRIRVEASAPSQAFLFGEHAVLYKKPALAAGVDRRAKAIVQEGRDKELLITSSAYPEPFRGVISGTSIKGEGNPDLEPIALGVAKLFDLLGKSKGLEIRIDSLVPIGSGMASSASVGAAISKAVSHLLGCELQGEDLLEAVYEFERIIHGKASKTGPACAVYGGLVWVEWINGEMRVSLTEFKESLPLVMICSKESTKTKKMIEKVSELRSRHSRIVDGILDMIATITIDGRKAILRGDLECLGRLMDFNHWLLSALGVSTPELDRIAWLARKNGALGAKLSGGGGGGCVVAVTPNPDSLVSKLKSEGLEAFKIPIAREGARIEHVEGSI
ncbi:MAG: mevalonate kinase [Thermoproteota archaeon]|nr:MAG: mevalonate kinase [Candidatus Korarchaeota archaeon]